MCLSTYQTPSLADAETGAYTDKVINEGDSKILNFGEEQGEYLDNKVYLEEKIGELDESQTRSYPGKTPESQPPPVQVLIEEDQARPDPGQSHDPLLYTYTFGNKFFNDKSNKDELGKQNVDAEVVSMVTVPIHQASTSVPPLSTPIIDLSPPKPIASLLLEPFMETTTEATTTTLLLPPPPQQQSITNLELAARVMALKKKLSKFEEKSQTLYNTTHNLGSRVFTLELQDRPHKINQTVNKIVKEAVYVAFQAPLRDRFRELPEADMKEILHQRMFKSGSYKSLPEHVAVYEALKASMEWANRDEFLTEKDKSRMRCRDDQDPPPPLDSDLRKKKA
nr:hypothetical protein [Tanacetum cinerariifolium]